MKRRFKLDRPTVDTFADLAKPCDPSIGQRIRDAINQRSPIETAYPPLFDELEDQPSHSMDADPLRSFSRDAFDNAMTVLDNLGSKADIERVSKDMKGATGSAEPKGAQHTEQGEVNDPQS